MEMTFHNAGPIAGTSRRVAQIPNGCAEKYARKCNGLNNMKKALK